MLLSIVDKNTAFTNREPDLSASVRFGTI